MDEMTEVSACTSIWPMVIPARHSTIIAWLQNLIWIRWFLWLLSCCSLLFGLILLLESVEGIVGQLYQLTMREHSILLQYVHDDLPLLYTIITGLDNWT